MYVCTVLLLLTYLPSRAGGRSCISLTHSAFLLSLTHLINDFNNLVHIPNFECVMIQLFFIRFNLTAVYFKIVTVVVICLTVQAKIIVL